MPASTPTAGRVPFQHRLREGIHMKWNELVDQDCSMARSLAVIGDRWTLLILRECFFRVPRFDDFQARLGIERPILTSSVCHEFVQPRAVKVLPGLSLKGHAGGRRLAKALRPARRQQLLDAPANRTLVANERSRYTSSSERPTAA